MSWFRYFENYECPSFSVIIAAREKYSHATSEAVVCGLLEDATGPGRIFRNSAGPSNKE
jgi:RNase P protein component